MAKYLGHSVYVRAIRFDFSYTSTAVKAVISHIQNRTSCVTFLSRGMHRHDALSHLKIYFIGRLISPCTR